MKLSQRIAVFMAILSSKVWPSVVYSKPLDLSPMIEETVKEQGLVAAAAFVASSTGTCAIGSGGVLATSKPDSPVSLWESPWHAGSMTKAMTASLAALLVKDETVPLSYETTLGDIFPDDALDTPYATVTLENLLVHRGGFRNDYVTEFPLHVSELEDLDGDYSMPLLEQRQALMRYALSTEPVMTPGEEFRYSNMGYTIAGTMMESVTGVAWEDMLINRLFTPLGIKSAYFGCPDTPQSPLGHYYDADNGLLPVEPASFCSCIETAVCDCELDLHTAGLDASDFSDLDIPSLYAQSGPAGMVYMQLSDYVRFYQWHLAGELGWDTSGLLSTEEFHRMHTGVGGEITLIWDEVPHEYGHGWAIFGEDNNPFEGLEGPVLFHGGSNLLWLSHVWIAPEMDRVYFTATNSVQNMTGAPSEYGLGVILENMAANTTTGDLQDDADCHTSIESLDQGRDPGNHETCPVLVYGEDYDRSDGPKNSISLHVVLASMILTVMATALLTF